jgi:putative transport protein
MTAPEAVDARRRAVRRLGLALTLIFLVAAPLVFAFVRPPPGLHRAVSGALGFLAKEPFVLLFLVVTGGYVLGRVQVRGVGLGTTGATLVVALEMSVWALEGEGIKFEVAGFASTVFFNLFMFAIGMKVGPQFVSGLKGNVGKFVFLAVLIPGLSFAIVMAFKHLFTLEPGLLPGIFSGANTATPGLGAAQTAIAQGEAPLRGQTQEIALGNLSTAFAFTYCVTMVLFIMLLKLLPKLFRRDSAREAQDYVASMSGGGVPLPGEATAFLVGTLPVATRAYAVESEALLGHPLGEFRESHPLVAVERVLRDGRVLAPSDGLSLREGDAVALYGTVPRLIDVGPEIGHEIDAPQILERERQTVDLVVDGTTSVRGRTLGELAKTVGHGLYLNAMFRGGQSLPFGLDVQVRKGDVLRVTGGKDRIAELERTAGRVVRPSSTTDMVTLGLGLTFGAALGAVTVRLGSARLMLSASVGLLVLGIALSSLRTRNPSLGGPFPEPARQLLEDLGLSVFVAILGLNAGAGVIHAVKTGGLLPIVLGCLAVGLVPPLIGWLVGLYVLKMNSALLLGAVAGGSCNAAGMRAAQETTRSAVPAISYPVAFAIANVLFTLLTYACALLQ